MSKVITTINTPLSKIYSNLYYQIFPKSNIDSFFSAKLKEAKGNKIFSSLRQLLGESIKNDDCIIILSSMLEESYIKFHKSSKRASLSSSTPNKFIDKEDYSYQLRIIEKLEFSTQNLTQLAKEHLRSEKTNTPTTSSKNGSIIIGSNRSIESVIVGNTSLNNINISVGNLSINSEDPQNLINLQSTQSNTNNHTYEFDEEEDTNEIKYLVDPLFIAPQIKAASFKKLISVCTQPSNYDVLTQRSFLRMYGQFGSMEEMLEGLEERYKKGEVSSTNSTSSNSANNKKSFFQPKTEKSEKKHNQIKLRVITFVKLWLQKQFYDFLNDQNVLLFSLFLQRVEKENSSHFSELNSFYQKKLLAEKEVFNSFVLPPLVPSSFSLVGNENPLNKFSIFTLSPQQLALQITILHYHSLMKIQANEFMKQAWSKKDAKEKAPNLLNFIQLFNNLSEMIVTFIVEETKKSKRVQLVEKFIQMAKEFESLNNFNGIMAVIASINTSPILRLKKTWSSVPQEIMEIKDRLTELMSHKFNFKNYREALKTCQIRGINAIPNLSVSLSDLVFVDEGNTDYLYFDRNETNNENTENTSNENKVKLINFEKCIQVHNIITQVLDFQRPEFYSSHTVDYEIRYWILNCWNPLSQEESYKRSVAVEPKNTEEAIETLLMESEKQKQMKRDLLIKISELEAQVEFIERSNSLLNDDNQLLRKKLKEKEMEKNVKSWSGN